MLIRRSNTSVSYQVDEKLEEKTIRRVFKRDEAPIYARNAYILDGYRISKNFKESWRSLTYLHNETGNIYIHILATLIFSYILYDIWIWDTEFDLMDKLMFSVFCICSIKCFLCSTLFHLHCNQCIKTHNFFACLDYSGISFMVMGSSMIVTYYLYYCSAESQILHLTFIGSLSMVGVVGSFVDYFKKHPLIRVYVYMATGFSSAIPSLLHVYNNSLVFPFAGMMGAFGLILMTVFYVGGACIYALRVPERYAPGAFDYLFHSHQIWHWFALFAALATYCLALDVYQWHKIENQCILV
eukprot:NODE_9_length_47730_cov_0.323718.p14 type:complete len:298 gc:universal NODE_9_length_47730_cov_0.323718:19809-18916(-)